MRERTLRREDAPSGAYIWNKNSLLEEKIKTEVENTLGMAEEGEGGKKKKPGDKKQEKKYEN